MEYVSPSLSHLLELLRDSSSPSIQQMLTIHQRLHSLACRSDRQLRKRAVQATIADDVAENTMPNGNRMLPCVEHARECTERLFLWLSQYLRCPMRKNADRNSANLRCPTLLRRYKAKEAGG